MKTLCFAREVYLSMMVLLMMAFVVWTTPVEAEDVQKVGYLYYGKEKLNCFKLTRGEREVKWDHTDLWFYDGDKVAVTGSKGDCDSASLTIRKIGGGDVVVGGENGQREVTLTSANKNLWIAIRGTLWPPKGTFSERPAGTERGLQSCNLRDLQYVVPQNEIYVPLVGDQVRGYGCPNPASFANSTSASSATKVFLSLLNGDCKDGSPTDSVPVSWTTDKENNWLVLEGINMQMGKCYQLSIENEKQPIKFKVVASIDSNIEGSSFDNFKLGAYRFYWEYNHLSKK